MMAGLFGVFALALIFSILKKRVISIICIAVGLLLSLAMFSHHATDILKINW